MTKPNANVSIQVLPRVKGADSIPIVDKVIELIMASGVKYVVGPMETTMEGDLDTLMDIVTKAQKLCIAEGANNVYSMVKIAYCDKGVLTIDEKITKYKQ